MVLKLLVRCPEGQQFLTITERPADMTVEALAKQISRESKVVGVSLVSAPGLQKKFLNDVGEASYFVLPGYAKVQHVLSELDLVHVHAEHVYTTADARKQAAVPVTPGDSNQPKRKQPHPSHDDATVETKKAKAAAPDKTSTTNKPLEAVSKKQAATTTNPATTNPANKAVAPTTTTTSTTEQPSTKSKKKKKNKSSAASAAALAPTTEVEKVIEPAAKAGLAKKPTADVV
ncbi:hypothetical protein AaE_009110, partial [Aphanomyces astaci]